MAGDIKKIKNLKISIETHDILKKYCHLFTELHISHIDNNEIGNVTFPDLTNLNPKCVIKNYHF